MAENCWLWLFLYSQPELTAADLFLAVVGVSPGKRGEDDDNGAVDEDVVDVVVVAGWQVEALEKREKGSLSGKFQLYNGWPFYIAKLQTFNSG